jgi:hypothetical protein
MKRVIVTAAVLAIAALFAMTYTPLPVGPIAPIEITETTR